MSVPRKPSAPYTPPSEVLTLALAEVDSLSAQSRARFEDLLTRFISYLANGHGIDELRDVEVEHVRGFVLAPATSGAEPSPATTHLRRSAVRLLFREARRLGGVEHDPTIDLVLQPRSASQFRPLSNDEVLVCRSASLASLVETRRPAAWALAEAGARTSEIARILTSDLDLENERVWTRGDSKTLPRWIRPTDWGLLQLRRRAALLQDVEPLVYQARGTKQSAQASACIAINSTLTRAGLGAEPDLRPLSVTAWAGLQAFRSSGRIEDAARVLGMRSLDGAARLIGWNWQEDEVPDA